MDSKTYQKLAEQVEQLSEQFLAISQTFRDAAGGSEDSGDDAPSARPGKAGGAAAKKAANKPVTKPAVDDDEVDVETVREKLKELAETKGKEAMVAALASVGAAKLAEVDESQLKELLDKAQELLDADEDTPAEKPKPAAKKTATKAKAKSGPTLEELQEAAKALIDADKPAFVKLSKKYGKPSECDESKYAAYIEDIQAAMPSDDGDDDLL